MKRLILTVTVMIALSGCRGTLDNSGTIHWSDDGQGDRVTLDCGTYSSPDWDCPTVFDSYNRANHTDDPWQEM